MTRQTITTPHAPSSPTYGQGVKAGSTLYVSGMVGVDPTNGELAGASIGEQTRQALQNCEAVLDAGGCTLDDVALVTVLLAHPADFSGMNDAYVATFGEDPPARAVARLGPELPGVLVSIMMTAHLSD